MGHQNNVASERAVNKSSKKKTESLTTEERITAIRRNIEGGLYVPVTEVKLLLEQYDLVVASRENIITGEDVKLVTELLDNPGVIAGLAEQGLEPVSRAGEAVAELETIPRG